MNMRADILTGYVMLLLLTCPAFCQGADDARKHLVRGMAAIEMAKGEEDLVGAVEGQAALGRSLGAEHRAVGVEVLEVVEGTTLHVLQQGLVVLIRGAVAKLIPAGADAAFEEGDHGA